MAEKSEREKKLEMLIGHIVVNRVVNTGNGDEIDRNVLEHLVRTTAIGTRIPREEVKVLLEECDSRLRLGGGYAS